MNLTLGVHGPKFMHAILFDDARQIESEEMGEREIGVMETDPDE